MRAIPAHTDLPVARGHQLAGHGGVGNAGFLVSEGVFVGIEDEPDRRSAAVRFQQRLDNGAAGQIEHRDVDVVALAGRLEPLEDGPQNSSFGDHSDSSHATGREVRGVVGGARRRG